MEAATSRIPGGPPVDVLDRDRAWLTRDRALGAALLATTLLVLAAIVYFIVRMVGESRPVFDEMGVIGYVTRDDWNVSHAIFGALPLVVGTLITSVIALAIGVPVAISAALFATELCPWRLRRLLAATIELLAAVPSVVYGLWGFFVLIPALRPVQQWLSDTFSFLPFVGGHVAGPSYFIAGLILAIMIVPIVSAISRDVLLTVPREQREAALALGATRWEMIRHAVLPAAKRGVFSASILGLGRALGETIAVTIVIGNAPAIGHSIFDQGYTLAAVIANEFGEAASNQLHRSALIAAGLTLFVMTLIVNVIARAIVNRSGVERMPRRQREILSRV